MLVDAIQSPGFFWTLQLNHVFFSNTLFPVILKLVLILIVFNIFDNLPVL